MFDHNHHTPHTVKRWLRHTASVPKGFLRYHVLRLLREGPLSGSEIMEIIEKGTDGQWKPSPGSVYPLLAWLQEGKYTKEIPTEESGMKRYRLTEKGKSFLKEQNTLRENLQKKLEFFAPPIFSSFLLGTHPESFKIIREAEKRFIKALFNLRRALEINLSREIAEEIRDFLNNSTDMIEELCTKIKGRSS